MEYERDAEERWREIDDIGPAILGSPQSDAFTAYRIAVAGHPLVSQEESDVLGRAIYHGRLASERLAQDGEALQAEEYSELSRQAEMGLHARRVMASRHLALVIGLSRNFAYDRERRFSSDRRAEMVGVGNVALVRCMERYVHIPGQHFAGYAARSVTNAMIGEMMANIRSDTGRSHRMQRELLEIDAAYQLAVRTGEDVSFYDVAERLGYEEARVNRILNLSERRPVSLDEPIIAQLDSGLKVADVIEDPTVQTDYESVEASARLTQVRSTAQELRRRQVITDVEWKVFTGRYYEGLTQQDIADELGDARTQSGVSLIEQRVLAKIRKEIESPGAHDKKSDAGFRIVESAVDLLEVLELPTGRDVDVIESARKVINNIPLTARQRKTMHALMGTSDGHYRPKEYARKIGRTHRAVYDAREKAMRNIMQAWSEMSDEERLSLLSTPKDTYPTIVSRGPKTSTPQGVRRPSMT